MVETIGFPVTANQSSAGDYLPIDSDTLAGCTVTNSSAYAVEYSTGGAWKTIAAGGSATINTMSIATTSLRFRKKTGDSIPVVLSVAVTHPGTAPAHLVMDAAGNVLGLAGPSNSRPAIGSVLDFYDWSNGTATENTAVIQLAVDSVGAKGVVNIPANLGVVEINGTIYHDNIINVGAGTTLKLKSGSTCTMFKSRLWDVSRTAASGATSSGRVGVITLAAVPAWVTVGGLVSVLGATNDGYNGVHVVTSKNATTVSVRLPRTPSSGTATGSVTIAPVDELVGLVGSGVIDYNESGQTADGTKNTIATIWRNVGTCVVGDGLTVKNAKKFCFLIAGYRYADVDTLFAETASDIFHFLGPGTNTSCSNVYGSSGDDSLAFTIGDVAWFDDGYRGDFYTVNVSDINCDSTQALIRISGNTGWKFWDVCLNNLSGSSVASPVTIADYSAELRGLAFDTIRINGINCETTTAVPVVTVSTQITGGGNSLFVDATQLPSNGAVLSVSSATTTVRNVNVRAANPIDGCAAGALVVAAGATVNSATVSDIRAVYASNVFCVWIVGSLSELRVQSCEVGGSGSRVVAQQGTAGRIMLDNIRHTSGYRTFEQNAAANAGCTVSLSNVRANSITNLVHFTKSATLFTSNTEVPSGGATAAISADGATTVLTWRGDASFTGVTESALTNSATLTKSSSVVA